MFQNLSKFFNGISINRVGKLGVYLVSISFVSFFIFEILQMTGILNNAFIALICYLSFPIIFTFGLLLILFGWYKFKRKVGSISDKFLEKKIGKIDVQHGIFGSKFSRTLYISVLVALLFFILSTIRMLVYMDHPFFCGTACHTIMNPEWVAYQNSPHARVKCVDCHVGYGLQPLIDSKINGTRQMILATLNMYKRPIPTPVHRLRPARETCEQCHWPSKFYGTKIKKIVHYKRDSLSTPKYTTLAIKIDDVKNEEKSGIHWHISKENKIRYLSLNGARKDMLWVEVKQKDGSFKRFTNKSFTGISAESEKPRTFDCVDCHNRATHIYPSADMAVDAKIKSGELPKDLPFIKREAEAAILPMYPTKDAAFAGIESYIYNFYKNEFKGNLLYRLEEIDKMVETLQEIYDTNIHPEMNIEWNTYESLIGHKGNSGCFRCHNQSMVSDNGESINHDCTLCHSILANEEDEPFKYLQPVKVNQNEKQNKNIKMHQYLREEFLKNSN